MKEYFVGGRRTGPWLLGLTWIATMASGGTFIGVLPLIHSCGWIVLWIAHLMRVITTGFGILGRRVGRPGAKSGAHTFPDLLRERFESPFAGMLSAVMIGLLDLATMVAQHAAGGRVPEAVVGIPYARGVIGFAVSVGFHTAHGGFRTVAWTDSFQAIVMLAGVIPTAILAVRLAGGTGAIDAELARQNEELLSGPGPDFPPLVAAVSLLVPMPLSRRSRPALIGRFLTSIGIASQMLVPDIEAPDDALTAVVVISVLAPLAGFVIADPVSAIMSSPSSFPLVTPGALVRDIHERAFDPEMGGDEVRRLTHVVTGATIVVGLVPALNPPQELQLIVVFAGTGLGATIAWPSMLAIFWPRMNEARCLAGIFGGFLSFVAQHSATGGASSLGFHPFVRSRLISLAGGVIGSLMTPRQGQEHLRTCFGTAAAEGDLPIGAQPQRGRSRPQAGTRTLGASSRRPSIGPARERPGLRHEVIERRRLAGRRLGRAARVRGAVRAPRGLRRLTSRPTRGRPGSGLLGPLRPRPGAAGARGRAGCGRFRGP